jgi:hypothetical protein
MKSGKNFPRDFKQEVVCSLSLCVLWTAERKLQAAHGLVFQAKVEELHEV